MRNHNVNNDGDDIVGRGDGAAHGNAHGNARPLRDLANPHDLRAPVSPRDRVRGIPCMTGFALLMAAVLIGCILTDRPSVFPWGVGPTVTLCAVLAVVGVALIAAAFIRPHPPTDDERRAIARAARRPAESVAKEARRGRLRFLAAAALMLVWGVAWIVTGGVRFGWGAPAFRDWAASGLWAVASGVIMIVAGLLIGRSGYGVPVPRGDERDRLVGLRAEAATGRIMAFACILLEVALMTASLAFDSAPLMYVGLGLLIAFVLHSVVSAIAAAYYERRM